MSHIHTHIPFVLEEFGSHIVRLGGFHAVCCFISAIGKLWGDGGLKDLLADSGVYAEGSVDLMLAGKQFHRAIMGIPLAYEAFNHLLLCSFLKWC